MNFEDDKQEIKRRSNSQQANKSPQKIISDHLFAFDVTYSKIFSKKKEETDDDFFNTFNNLTNVNLSNEMNLLRSNTNDFQENASIKDESLINKDILNFLESPNINSVRKKRKLSDQSSNLSDDNGKRLSNLILNKEKNSEDFEIKLQRINDRENVSPILRESTNKLLEDIKEEEKEKGECLNTSNISDDFFTRKKNFISKDILGPCININNISNNNKLNPNIPNYYFNPNYVNSYYNPNPNIEYSNRIPAFDVNFNYNQNFNNNNNNNTNNNKLNPILPFKVNNIFNPSPRDAVKITNMYKYPQHNSETPLRSIYENYIPNKPYNFCENQTKEHLDVNICPTTSIHGGSLNNNSISFEDFNKFNTSRVESSELNSRKLKTNKIIKCPNGTEFEELSNEDIERFAFSLAKDQAGCRFLQRKLDEIPNLALRIFHKLLDRIIELMNDSFGNYLIQKILEKVNESMIQETLIAIAPHFQGLGFNPHGTRVLQKLIELLYNENLLHLYTRILTPYIENFIKDINGNHIIQKFVFFIGSPRNQFLFNLINNKIVEIATHKHGCCVLQKCIEGASATQRDELIKLIIKHTQLFVVDQYGNYVVQYVIMLKDFNANKLIADEFLKMNIIAISKQKFSSNVVEKCFDNCNDETRANIIKEISNPEIVYHILFDNYVLQKALYYSREPYYSMLITYISSHLEKLKNHFPFGNKLYLKLINSYSEFQSIVTMSESPNKWTYTDNIYNNSNLNSNQSNYLDPNVNWMNRQMKSHYTPMDNTRIYRNRTNKFTSTTYNN